MEVVAADRDDVFRIAAGAERRMVMAPGFRRPFGIAAVRSAAASCSVGAAEHLRQVDVPDLAKHPGIVVDPLGDDVDYLAFALHLAGDADHR